MLSGADVAAASAGKPQMRVWVAGKPTAVAPVVDAEQPTAPATDAEEPATAQAAGAEELMISNNN